MGKLLHKCDKSDTIMLIKEIATVLWKETINRRNNGFITGLNTTQHKKC